MPVPSRLVWDDGSPYIPQIIRDRKPRTPFQDISNGKDSSFHHNMFVSPGRSLLAPPALTGTASYCIAE